MFMGPCGEHSEIALAGKLSFVWTVAGHSDLVLDSVSVIRVRPRPTYLGNYKGIYRWLLNVQVTGLCLCPMHLNQPTRNRS